MKILIHAGNYKTGSTSIQAFLASNSELLETNEIYYPKCGRQGDAHHVWAQSLHGRAAAPKPEELFPEIQKELENCGYENVLVSSEVFFHTSIPKLLKQHLPDAEFSFTAYLRRQDYFASAFYLQLVKHPRLRNGEAASLDRFLRKQGPIDYLGVLNCFAESFGKENIQVHPYETSQVGGDVVQHFQETLGLKLEEEESFVYPPRINSTIPTELIEFLRIYNMSGPTQKEHGWMLAQMDALARKTETAKLFERGNVFSPADRIKLLEAFEEDSREIAMKYCNRPDGRLFLDPWPSADDAWKPMGVSNQALSLILASLWQDVQGKIMKADLGEREVELSETLETLHQRHLSDLQIISDLRSEVELLKRRLPSSVG